MCFNAYGRQYVNTEAAGAQYIISYEICEHNISSMITGFTITMLLLLSYYPHIPKSSDKDAMPKPRRLSMLKVQHWSSSMIAFENSASHAYRLIQGHDQWSRPQQESYNDGSALYVNDDIKWFCRNQVPTLFYLPDKPVLNSPMNALNVRISFKPYKVPLSCHYSWEIQRSSSCCIILVASLVIRLRFRPLIHEEYCSSNLQEWKLAGSYWQLRLEYNLA